MPLTGNIKKDDYRWLIVIAGCLCIFACIGLGRFTLGMILPSMSDDLGFSYSEMGFIGTANFIGYLSSVVVSGFLVRLFGARLVITAALVCVGASIILLGFSKDFVSATVLYTVTGFGSGASNIPMMALVAKWFVRHQRGRAAGFIVMGSGFAIILSGKLIPYINEHCGAMGWRINWWIVGSMVLLIALFCLLLLRNSPEDVGGSRVEDTGDQSQKRRLLLIKDPFAYYLGLVYFIFGFTYVIYVTFIVTLLVKERGVAENIAGNFWSYLGLLSLISGPLFGTLSDRIGRDKALGLVFFSQSLSYILVAAGGSGLSVYLSIIFFGIVAWSIPSIMAALVGDVYGADRTPAVFGFVTFIFGLGQVAGPAIAGLIAEKSGTLSYSFILAFLFSALAVWLSLRIKKEMLRFET